MPRLEVRVCGARGLKNTEFFGTIDPYATIEFEGMKYKTAVCDNTTNPEWNEVFKFNCRDENTSQITIGVWNQDTVSDEFLGEYRLSIGGLQRGHVEDTWVLLSNCKGNAEVHIRYCAIDFGDVPPEDAPQPQQGFQQPPQGYQQPPQGYQQPPQGYQQPPQGYQQPPQGYLQPPQGYQQPPQGYQQPPQGYQQPPQGFPPQSFGPALQYTRGWYGTDAQPSAQGVVERLGSIRRGPSNVYVPANMNGTMGYDPLPGVPKVTCLTGQIGPVEVVVRVPEGVEFSFDFKSQPSGQPIMVVDAWYGIRGQQECRDGAVQKVMSMMRGPGYLVIPANKNAVFGDPAPGVVKTLFVRAMMDRSTIDLYVPEPQEFTFCA